MWLRLLHGTRHAGAGTWSGGTTPLVCRQGRCEGHPCVCVSVSLSLSPLSVIVCVSDSVSTLIVAAHGGGLCFSGSLQHLITHTHARNHT